MNSGSQQTGRRNRWPLVILMLVAVVASGFVRQQASTYQARATAIPGLTTARSSLGNMNSFTLALLLGGLRGPLVMFLWMSSENQKIDKNMEDFNTRVELIRLLQPEFVSVLLYQIWNKAYNASVQMASLPNRYAAVVDGLDYAWKIEHSRPGLVDVKSQIAMIYSNKLGAPSQEKYFYRRQVREDSMWRQESGRKFGEEGFTPNRLPPMLDKDGNLLKDGMAGEFKFIRKYEPFPYGVSVFALAHEYHKQAAELVDTTGQTPKQVSAHVVDSSPALDMKFWAEEEHERGRRAEIKALGINFEPNERLDAELPSANAPTQSAFSDPQAMKLALYSYDMAKRVATDGLAEYRRHLGRPEYAFKADTYASHLEHLQGIEQMMLADAAYLRAIQSRSDAERAGHAATAKEAYLKAQERFEYIVLRRFLPDNIAQQTWGGMPAKINDFTPEQRSEFMRRLQPFFATNTLYESGPERTEYLVYLSRIGQRLQHLGNTRPAGNAG